MLAGVIKPTKGTIEYDLKISYKPQYITPEFEGTVQEYFENSHHNCLRHRSTRLRCMMHFI